MLTVKRPKARRIGGVEVRLCPDLVCPAHPIGLACRKGGVGGSPTLAQWRISTIRRYRFLALGVPRTSNMVGTLTMQRSTPGERGALSAHQFIVLGGAAGAAYKPERSV
jgi:hypothetical protein